MNQRYFKGVLALGAMAALSACSSPPKPGNDYAAFQQAKPASILVMPPVNHSPDVKASHSVWAQTVWPLAESGYYVVPPSVVAETLRENGMVNPEEAAQALPQKLREFFGADAALYIDVKEYGTSYRIISSESRVTVDARLVDLRTGEPLWSGSASASTAESQDSSSGGLVGALVKALITQISDSISNASHPMAGLAGQRLLMAGRPGGILYGPRSPLYGKDSQGKAR
jgi:hypothetical protein